MTSYSLVLTITTTTTTTSVLQSKNRVFVSNGRHIRVFWIVDNGQYLVDPIDDDLNMHTICALHMHIQSNSLMLKKNALDVDGCLCRFPDNLKMIYNTNKQSKSCDLQNKYTTFDH
ncbi:hypothetical protein DERF_006056 [Dermatophagoides farinae]|uniref:Uncharacterized protein n=1 Tax=Dermatophagoides farinae TaxID=6954 RepID=A0A922LBV1_DERFA|nr:hypothetical protein DERF_006056 [Dermatophagoides farinae]